MQANKKTYFDKLESKRSDIEACIRSEDYEGLAALLRDYRLAANRYLAKGMALCPSKEYLDLLCKLLRHDGENAKADKLETLAPIAHYRPLGR